MNKYMQEPDYPELDEEKRVINSPDNIFPSKEQFDIPLRKVRTMIEQLQNGTSDLSNYAIHLVKGTCPAISCLNAFESNPTEKTLKAFIELSRSDFNWKTAKAFAHEFGAVWPRATKWVQD